MNRFTEVERVVRRKVHMHNSCTNDARVNFNELKHVLLACIAQTLRNIFFLFTHVLKLLTCKIFNIKLKICAIIYI